MGAEVLLVLWDVVFMCLLACTIKSNDFFVHIYLIIAIDEGRFEKKIKVDITGG